MSNLFKILNPNFFQILSSVNKDIYIDCLLLLEELTNEDDYFNINKNTALNALERYFQQKSKVLLQENNDETEVINNNRQKASKIIHLFHKNGWLGEEKISYNITNLHFFDYSIEIIYFLKKTINQTKPESIENIYSIYHLLKSFLTEINYNIFKEIIIITNNLIIKLKILKANIYRFYNELINMNSNNNLQNILEKLLSDYKKNFFDSSYYVLKTTNNLFKYRSRINLFLNKIGEEPIYFEQMNEQLSNINQNNKETNTILIKKQIQEIKQNIKLTDHLIEIIDKKNEQYLEISCDRILFFDNKKKNITNLLNFAIQLLLEDKEDYSFFFNFWFIKNLDDFSFYKPRVNKQEISTSELEIIPEEIESHLIEKKQNFLNKKNLFDRKNINLFVQQILNQKQSIKASQLTIQDHKDISKLILIYLYSQKNSSKNIYQIQSLKQQVNNNYLRFSDFLIFKI
ncbi:Wadjet anti-phage system protein JetA family protein ['Camptotheca acuminata' phytoplasma]|uniref:Wadjet anti-phage system protein JetA family protein n=1 Tax='Camptotheca acuminata' phytoplasma TaxID=3239192 RepID=UPI00351A6338